jgi:D-sedoheptulose 7-phosphate isomerase
MTDDSKKIIMDYALAGAILRENFLTAHAGTISIMAKVIAASLAQDGKILFCGNGGSAADAQHLAAELTNRFLMDRPPLPGLALTTDTSALTAISNDFGFEHIFSKQIRALGRESDILLAISTSGASANITNALKTARELNMITMGLTGKGGGDMPPLCDYLLDVPDDSTPLIQEIHITVGHLLCRLIDYYLFENVAALQPHLKTQPEQS